MPRTFKTAALSVVGGHALLLSGAAALSSDMQRTPGRWENDSANWTEGEDTRRSFVLSPGARVEVSGTAGGVTVETTTGNSVEVHIIRKAATRRDLDCSRVEVEGSAQRVRIEHRTNSRGRDCNIIRARQEVRLQLPRWASVEVTGVAGSVNIPRMEGEIRLRGVAGRSRIGGARIADISGTAGAVTLTVTSTTARTTISGTAGPVDIEFERGSNADVRVSGTLGSVRSMSPDIRLMGRDGFYRARIGRGGTDVSVSGTVGAVRLRRAS
jgi:hypothetical protein